MSGDATGAPTLGIDHIYGIAVPWLHALASIAHQSGDMALANAFSHAAIATTRRLQIAATADQADTPTIVEGGQ